MLVAVSVTGSAAVGAGPANRGRGDKILIAPPAPPGAQMPGIGTAAAAEPRTSPGVTTHPIDPGGTFTCSAGYFCPIVWNPVTGKWKIFFMYYCRIQTLYDWIGDGYYYNNQIPPVNPVQIYDEFGMLTHALVVENPRRLRPFNWSPAWSIDVC